MNPERNLPARPGSFYSEGDVQRFKPHHITSKLKARLMPQSEQPISPDTPLARCCCFHLHLLFMTLFVWSSNECAVA